MDVEKKPEVIVWGNDPREPSSFEAMLDTTCERLKEKHIQYSIRRIDEMALELAALEKELNDFLCSKK